MSSICRFVVSLHKPSMNKIKIRYNLKEEQDIFSRNCHRKFSHKVEVDTLLASMLCMVYLLLVEEHCCFVFLLFYMLKVSVLSECSSVRGKENYLNELSSLSVKYR